VCATQRSTPPRLPVPIVDDDALAVSVSAAPHTVEEGSPAGFDFTLGGAISSEVTLEWATADGTVTIGALADLGYSVSYGQADPYTLPGSTSSRLQAASLEIDLGNHVREGPFFELDPPEQDIPVITP